jgi:hypothetical protein
VRSVSGIGAAVAASDIPTHGGSRSSPLGTHRGGSCDRTAQKGLRSRSDHAAPKRGGLWAARARADGLRSARIRRDAMRSAVQKNEPCGCSPRRGAVPGGGACAGHSCLDRGCRHQHRRRRQHHLRDGYESAIEDTAAPVYDRRGHVTGAVIVFHDVSAARAMSLRMSYLAQHDFLTGSAHKILAASEHAPSYRASGVACHGELGRRCVSR